MHILNDKALEFINTRLALTNKKIGNSVTFVRLNAADLATMSTANTGYEWYGKLVCVGLTDNCSASHGTTVEWTAANAYSVTGGLSGTFYDVMFNKFTGSPTAGTIYFVGIKVEVVNV